MFIYPYMYAIRYFLVYFSRENEDLLANYYAALQNCAC